VEHQPVPELRPARGVEPEQRLDRLGSHPADSRRRVLEEGEHAVRVDAAGVAVQRRPDEVGREVPRRHLVAVEVIERQREARAVGVGAVTRDGEGGRRAHLLAGGREREQAPEQRLRPGRCRAPLRPADALVPQRREVLHDGRSQRPVLRVRLDDLPQLPDVVGAQPFRRHRPGRPGFESVQPCEGLGRETPGVSVPAVEPGGHPVRDAGCSQTVVGVRRLVVAEYRREPAQPGPDDSLVVARERLREHVECVVLPVGRRLDGARERVNRRRPQRRVTRTAVDEQPVGRHLVERVPVGRHAVGVRRE